jgi:hypothetical protein
MLTPPVKGPNHLLGPREKAQRMGIPGKANLNRKRREPVDQEMKGKGLEVP